MNLPDIESPITLASLDAQLIHYRAVLAERRILFPPGTIDGERNDAYYAIELLEAGRSWLVEQGLDSAPYIGSLGRVTIQRGDRVSIRRGALVTSTRGGPTTSRSVQTITVHWVDAGYIGPDHSRGFDGRNASGMTVREPSVTWAGSGGYWRRTALSNVLMG